ncbi:hypothetical protein GIB67_006555 [Kingdonia uniflora]|uniref:Uncharacterized protein n=1 Tax=Kingdonia uniflora TaxID=39325 RepID=A0A7J7LEY8_9MAGN|nr:hypothetical protein GIB67_006555 [Kingdonia uniflora]
MRLTERGKNMFLRGCFAEVLSFVGIRYSSPSLAAAMANIIPTFTLVLAAPKKILASGNKTTKVDSLQVVPMIGLEKENQSSGGAAGYGSHVLPKFSNFANTETTQHLLWDCRVASNLRQWVCNLFNMQSSASNLKEQIDKGKTFSPLLKELWNSISMVSTYHIWYSRNKSLFDGLQDNNSTSFMLDSLIKFTHRSVSDADIRKYQAFAQILQQSRGLGSEFQLAKARAGFAAASDAFVAPAEDDELYS